MRFYIILFWALSLFYSCSSDKKPEFSNWYQSKDKSTLKTEKPEVYQANFYSTPLHIDTIYRSMQGPYEVKNINIDTEEDQLIWVTAYESTIENAESPSEQLPDKFMCHNNLNYYDNDKIPWKIKTIGSNSRIFTLTEGQTKIKLPNGFGVPLPANHKFELVSQVLNHEEDSIDISTRHYIKISYVKDSELDSPLTPLYQQAVFVTKQISGPAGDHGLPSMCIAQTLDSTKLKGMDPQHDCSVDFDKANYNPYEDKQGRKYTGHWILPYGKEELTTDVTQMLSLDKNNRIHMIGTHLHPFAIGLELWDKTTDSLLFAPNIKSKTKGMGFENISYYSSQEGIPVYKEHQYELKSIYNCTDSVNQHTAMAVMYIYLVD